MQQWFMNNNASDYKITDKVNTYNTMLNSTKNISNASAGFTVGVRYFLGRDQDRDGDGIPDRKDNCPTKIGLKQFCGCPDSDKDGIPDNEDRCPLAAGPECTGGCPDKDGDCVADIEDQCPTVFGTEDSGCPFVDKDGDGVPDKEDRCPDVRGSKDNFGCPVSYNTGSPEVQHVVDTTFIPPHVQLSVKTVNFKSGQSTITKQVEAELDEAAETMMKYPNVMLLISGYTDNIGSYEGNMELSFKRGEAIKKYLRDKGIAPERMKVSGYGKLDPKAKNDTPENRANNRRVELELALPL